MENLTQVQVRTLGLYLHFRTVNPTILRLFGYNTKLYLILLVLSSIVTALVWFFVQSAVGCLFITFILGAIVRDIGHFRRTVRNWPLVREITDWEKAEELGRKLGLLK